MSRTFKHSILVGLVLLFSGILSTSCRYPITLPDSTKVVYRSFSDNGHLFIVASSIDGKVALMHHPGCPCFGDSADTAQVAESAITPTGQEATAPEKEVEP